MLNVFFSDSENTLARPLKSQRRQENQPIYILCIDLHTNEQSHMFELRLFCYIR